MNYKTISHLNYLCDLKDFQPGIGRFVFDGYDETSMDVMQRFVNAMERSEAPPLL